MDNDWTKVLSFPGYRIYKYEIDEQRITWRRGFCASPELKACEGPFSRLSTRRSKWALRAFWRWWIADSRIPELSIKIARLESRTIPAADTLPSDHDRQGRHQDRVEEKQYLRRHKQCTPMAKLIVNFPWFTRYTLVYCQKAIHWS